MSYAGIWNQCSFRWLFVRDLYFGIIPDPLFSSVLAFPTVAEAENARDEAARLMKCDPKHLIAKKLKGGMTPARRLKTALEQSLAADRKYCGHCGRRIKAEHLKKTNGEFIQAQALEHGEFVTVHVCSEKCQRQLAALNERTLECLDQEMVALRNVDRVRKSMQAYLRKKVREASQSPDLA
jgi:hypothetical protein